MLLFLFFSRSLAFNFIWEQTVTFKGYQVQERIEGLQKLHVATYFTKKFDYNTYELNEKFSFQVKIPKKVSEKLIFLFHLFKGTVSVITN